MASQGSAHPASRYRAGNGCLFTSNKCPPTHDLNSNNQRTNNSLGASCELPFGFLYTPMAVVDSDDDNNDNNDGIMKSNQQVPCIGEGLPPVLCLTCLCYLNLYSHLDPNHPGIWFCSVCGSKNAAPPELLQLDTAAPNPALISPQLEFRQPLPTRHSNHPTVSIILVMDANLPKEEAHEIPLALKHALGEQASNTTEYHVGLVVFDKLVSVYQLGISGMAACDVFTAEDGLTEHHLNARQYLTVYDHSAALDRLSMCLTAVYGAAEGGVNKENLEASNGAGGEKDSDTATMIPPPQKRLSRLEMLKQRKAERLKKQQSGSNDDRSPETPPQPAPASHLLSPWVQARRNNNPEAHPHRHAFRATGEAMHTALNLTTASVVAGEKPASTARILLFTNGCANFGDGSVVDHPQQPQAQDVPVGPDTVDPLKLARSIEFFDTLARSTPGVAIDVFCTGSAELGVASYQALVECSGGYVLPHESFQSPNDPMSSLALSPLQHNLSFLLRHTHVSSVQHASLFDNDGSSETSTFDGCIVDIRASSFLTPTHLVGPGELMSQDPRKRTRGTGVSVLPNERSAFALGSSLAAQKHNLPTHHLPSRDFVESTLTRLSVGRVDPLSTYSVMFRVNDSFAQAIPDTSSGHVVFQCIARFVNATGTHLVTRVSTHRLAIAKDVAEFLDSVDEEVIPVVLGKEAVYRSMYGREMQGSDTIDAPSPVQLESLAFRAQDDLDATIARISGAYRLVGLEQGSRSLDLTEEGGVRAAGSSFDFAFPPELSVALRRLYYLRRGPLLNPGPMRSLDDRLEIRSLFIRFPMEDCLCMMAPLLWRSSPTESTMEEIPPETLALWEDIVIAGDNYHTIFIWSGKQVTDANYNELRLYCKSFLNDRSEHRFPMPQLHVVAENDSMSRRFTALLAPSHGDPEDHALTNFPALSRLSAEALQTLRGKFKFYDPESDPSFRSWFWNVAGATSQSKDKGISLCE